MAEDKKFTLNKETLEDQLEKLAGLIEGDKNAIAESDAIIRDPNHVLINKESGQMPAKRDM